MKKQWVVKKKIDKEITDNFPDINPITLQLLFNRDITEENAIKAFLSPEYSLLNDPFLFEDMKEVVGKIKQAIENKDIITVYGDYDADGVTSSTVLSSCLKTLGAKCNVYIPDREKEGYGLNIKAVEQLKANGTKLIITVDCGISSYEQVELAKAQGLTVIITDHHFPPEQIPDCLILNPSVGSSYPFRLLAGVGVAFKLSQALFRTLWTDKKIIEANEKWLLDVVCIGTIADCVQLIGENRILTKFGLVVLNKTKRKGLMALIEGASLVPGEIGSEDVSFKLSPRINAAGRLDHADTAYRLLSSDSETESIAITERLNSINADRQQITEKIYRKILEEEKDNKGNIIFSLQEDCPMGIVGLVAGKIASYFNRPTFVLIKKDGSITGSGRSIPAFNMIESLWKMDDLFAHFGGHSQACGLSLKSADLFDEFKKRMLNIAKEVLTDEALLSKIVVDVDINMSEINWGLFEDLEKFSPFGMGNPKPLFLTRNLKVLSAREIGQDGKHLKLAVHNHEEENSSSCNCIGFGLSGAWRDDFKVGDTIDLVYDIDENRWNGNRELQLKVVDFRKTNSHIR